jgi:hypothetical protein
MNALRARACAAALFVVLGGSACGAKAPSTRPTQVESADLLQQVPADTPFLVHLFPEMVDNIGIGFGGEIVAKLKSRILSPEKLSGSSPKDRIKSEIGRELAPYDAAALARVGWDVDHSELVIYGHGIVPVLRASMDGAKARAALQRVIARAGVDVPMRDAGGAPYIVVSTKPDAPSLVVMFHAHQVAAALTYEPDAIVSHLALLEPAVPAFEETRGAWPRDPGAPRNAAVFFAINPHGIARAMRAGDFPLLSRGEHVEPPCMNALADVVDDLPKVVNEYWSDGDQAWTSYSLSKNALLAELVDGAPGLPHWIDDPLPDIELGVGIEPAKILAFVQDVWSRAQATQSVCGRDAQPALEFGPHGAALSHVRGLTVAGDIHGKNVHLGGELVADDAAPVWSWIGPTFFGQALPDLEPNKITPLGNLNNLELALGFNEKQIWGSLGSAERALQLGKPGLVPPVPGTLLRFHISQRLIHAVRAGEVFFFGFDFAGEGTQYDSGMDIDASVRGDVVVVRTWGSMKVAKRK